MHLFLALKGKIGHLARSMLGNILRSCCHLLTFTKLIFFKKKKKKKKKKKCRSSFRVSNILDPDQDPRKLDNSDSEGHSCINILKDFRIAPPAKMLIYCQNVIF